MSSKFYDSGSGLHNALGGCIPVTNRKFHKRWQIRNLQFRHDRLR